MAGLHRGSVNDSVAMDNATCDTSFYELRILYRDYGYRCHA